MGILDKTLVFSDNQDIKANGTTVDSTNDIDLGVAAPNQGAGAKKVVRVRVGATAGAGGTSCKATLQHSTDDSTYTTLLDGVAVVTASLTAGADIAHFVLPPVHGRYLRIVYTLVGNMTALTADAYINIDP